MKTLDSMLDKVRVPRWMLTAGLAVLLGLTAGCENLGNYRRSAAANNRAGVTAVREGRPRDAEAKFTEAIRNDPSRAEPYNNRALVRKSQERYQDALLRP